MLLIYHNVYSKLLQKPWLLWFAFVLTIYLAHTWTWGAESSSAAAWMWSLYVDPSSQTQSPLYGSLMRALKPHFTPVALEYVLSGFAFVGVLLALWLIAVQVKGRPFLILLVLFWCLFGFSSSFGCAPGPASFWLVWLALFPFMQPRQGWFRHFYYGLGPLIDPWLGLRVLWAYAFSIKGFLLSLGPLFLVCHFLSLDWNDGRFFFPGGVENVFHTLPLIYLKGLGFVLLFFMILKLSTFDVLEMVVIMLSLGGVLSWGMPLEGVLSWVLTPFFCQRPRRGFAVTTWMAYALPLGTFLMWPLRSARLEPEVTWMLTQLPRGSVLWVQTPSTAFRLKWAQFRGLRSDVELLDIRAAGSAIHVKKGAWNFLEGSTEKFRTQSGLMGGVLPWSELSMLLPEGGSLPFEQWKRLVWFWVESPRFEEGANAPLGTKSYSMWKGRLERLDEILGLWLELFPQRVEVYLAAEQLAQFLEPFSEVAPASFKKHAFNVRMALKAWFPDHRSLHIELKKEAAWLLSSKETRNLFSAKEKKHLMEQFSLNDGPQRQRTP